MKPLPSWFRAMIRVASLVPPLGTAIGWRLFWVLGTPSAVRPSEREFHASAQQTRLGDVMTYQWGSGERPVLFVHGWRSRASRSIALSNALVDRGYTVVSFDARGHGDSVGKRTTAMEFADVIRQLGERHGEFEAVITHSFGTIPAFMAARSGVRTKRIVTIAGPHDFQSIVDTFAAGVGLSTAAKRGLQRHIERWARPLKIDVWRHVVAELDPTNTRTPLFVVHDTIDAEVPLDEAMKIVEAHTGRVETLITDGLGHNRVLTDQGVVDRVVRFVESPIDARRAAQADRGAGQPR